MAATGPAAMAGAALAGPATGPAGPMPPLQAPPEDDDWDRGDQPADGRRGGRRKWAWLAAALVLVLLLAGGAWFLLASGNRGSDGSEAGTSAPVSSSAGQTGILLDPGTYVGRPADEVETELEDAGLVVTQDDADEGQLAGAGQALDAGDVADLDKSGTTALPGTEVTLYVAEEAYTPGDGGEDEDTSTPTTSEAPASTTATTPTTATVTTSTTADNPSSASTSPPPAGGQPGEPPVPDPDPEEPGAGPPTGGGTEPAPAEGARAQ
jgi:serine/threonine-protein kinase